MIIMMKNYVKSDDKKDKNGEENCGKTKVLDDQNRFFPNLEEIPEESRCSTIMKENSKEEEEGEEDSESSGSNSGLGSLENRDDSGGTGKSNHQVTLTIIITVIKVQNSKKCFSNILFNGKLSCFFFYFFYGKFSS